MLQDYSPASAGKREASLRVGTQIEGELVFYPSRLPERAILAQYRIVEPDVVSWPSAVVQSPQQALLSLRRALPWQRTVTLLLGGCCLMQDNGAGYWLKAGDQLLPLANNDLPLLAYGEHLAAFICWDGVAAELLSVASPQWGMIAC